MAKLRGLGEGIGLGLDSLGNAFTQLGMKRYENDLITKRQEDLSALNQKEALVQKALSDPVFARRLKQSGLSDKLGLQIPQPTSEDILSPIGGDLSKANNEGEVDTPEGMIERLRDSGGIISDTPVEGQISVAPTKIAQLLAAQKAKVGKFTKMEDDKPVITPGVNAQGALTETHTTQGQVKGQAFQKDRSNLQNAQREGMGAGATVNAQEAARNSPTNVKGAAARAGAIKAAETANGGGNQANASATQYYVRALSAANNATKIEQQQVSGAGARYLPVPMQTQLQKQYNAAMNDFVATVVYLQSGKQINENEMNTYKQAYFVGPGDDAKTAAAKQAARARTIAGAKFIAEAGGGRGGLQEYIKNGGKLEDLINPGDPFFDKSDISLDKPKVYLDENGNPQ